MKEYNLELANVKWKMYLHEEKNIYGGEKILKENKFYEPETIKTCIKLLNQNSVFVDIGANIGEYAIPCAKIAKKAIVIEPDLDRGKWLLDNFRLNNLANTILFNCALANYSGIGYMGFNQHPSISAKNFRFSKKEIWKGSEQLIVNKFDNLFNEKIDVVKIDVEGSEYLVLDGMRKTITNNPNIKIVLEVHEKAMKDIFNIDTKFFYNFLTETLKLKMEKIKGKGLHYLLTK